MNLIGRARGSLAVLVAAGGLGLAGCSEPKPQVPTTFQKTAGDKQNSPVATAVSIAPAVTIKDADGRGIAGITVTFAVVSGGSSITGATATTDANGVAAVGSWTMGTLVGPNTLTAAAVNVPGSPVTFTATAVSGPAKTITKLSADPVSRPAGSNVDSIAVRVADQFGNAVAGETVSFIVTAGGGTVSPTSVVTGANGLAASRWTLGTTPDTPCTVTATRAGLASPTVTFSTTTSTGTPIVAVQMSAKLFIVDSLATITPGVTAFDPQGNAIANAGITLVASSPAIVTLSGSAVTGARTGQTFLVATSTDNPTAKDSALVVVANIASPVVRATIPGFDLKTDTTFTVPIIIDMRASGEKVGAATLQITWNLNVLSFVGEAEGVPAVGATINATAAATGSVTMAMASTAGFGGPVEIRRLTFKAVSVAGRTGSLVIVATDLSGASPSLTNLLPKTVTSFYSFKTR